MSGGRVRLVATAERNGQIHPSVEPMVLDAGDALATGTGVHNVVEVRAALAGTLTWHGAGAGGRSTASALLARYDRRRTCVLDARVNHSLPGVADVCHRPPWRRVVHAPSAVCMHCPSTRLLQLRKPFDAEPSAICLQCLGPLVPEYDATRTLPGREEIARRAPSLWRYREWLPFTGTPSLSLDSGFTPLVEAPELARSLGVARVWVKNDAVSHPTLSFKDRVVSTAINAAHAFGLGVIGCASTGNLANAVAAHAARAGLEAWIFIPHDLEPAKVFGTSVFAPKLVRVRGTYDDVNRLCAQVADSFGWGLVNVNLRAYYGEGSKTMAFEIIEQLGWRAPTAVVAPMAGGALVTKLHRGFREFSEAGLFTARCRDSRRSGNRLRADR